MKREPTLADLVSTVSAAKVLGYYNKAGAPAQELAQAHRVMQSRLLWAEKFVFDRDASRRVATVIRDIPELLVEQIQFARPPFDLCWIEYDLDALFEILNPAHYDPADRTRDSRIGLLIHHNRILVVTEGVDRSFGLLPFAYHLNTEWPFAEQLRFAEAARLSRLGIDNWLWGSCANTFRAQGKQDYLRRLRDTNMVELLVPPERISEQVAAAIINGSTGDLKNHLAMLLMLNQPRLTQYVAVPATRGWIGNKHAPFRKFTHIRMALDPVPMIRQVSEGRGEAELRRRHAVRGHWCHNDTARQAALRHSCVHDWQAADAAWELCAQVGPGDDIDHWLCSGCGGRRWWRAQHERGDASRGYVEHRTYDIVTQ